jgi:2-polyprenyl-3-methyl-5-hydroxy-6-metoxy-1,4-benzoquinol methylase
MDSKAHWDRVYQTNAPERVSWYQADPKVSLGLIRQAVPDTNAAIIDVGGGASTLVDGLVHAGYRRLTVLDVSRVALRAAQARLGAAVAAVNWIAADILQAQLGAGRFDLWHDRAVFHFLTSPRDRQRYMEKVRAALSPGGHVLIATFAPDGPSRCSGLDVARYSPEALHAELGSGFRLVKSVQEEHSTPSGKTQPFTYGLWQAEVSPLPLVPRP